jgi:molybdopterin-containing oxidoreductase family iron-sulfur binding subunit
MTEFHKEAKHLNEQTLYPDNTDYFGTGVKWGMYIDLNSCIGCGACQVACVSENNIPVVGKAEVNRHHEMTWLRIDRYFYGDLENPKVVYQPMMCQHCDNAPCENVCPVNATNHSMEGLNQMAYNRCIGTRYCANNCPYKVRRFNWLDYTTADVWPANEERVFWVEGEDKPFYADNLVRMVLNPDVTVRSRGVIEKCSFCIQRIQEGKLTAKRESRAILDNDVRSACQTACPTGAIVFGNLNNPDSAVVKARESVGALAYQALEEINVRPGVQYSAKIRNSNDTLAS